MAENTQVANFNTQLSYYTNRYVDLMERDLTSRGMEFDSYSKDCVVAAMGSIFQMVHESGVNFEAMVAVPYQRDVAEEFESPTPLGEDVEKWRLSVILKCGHNGSRKRSMTELLFCMVRSGH